MILIRNSSSNGTSKWHIYPHKKQIQNIKPREKPRCGTSNRQQMKAKHRPLHHMKAKTLNEAEKQIQNKLGQICQACKEQTQKCSPRRNFEKQTDNTLGPKKY